MQGPVDQAQEDPSLMLFSITTFLALQVNAFRNGAKDQDMGLIETMARRVVGELAYAAIAVAAAIETVFRLALAPLFFLPACLSSDKENQDFFGGLCVGSPLLTAETAFKSLSFLVQNIYQKNISYGEMQSSSLLC